MITALAFNHPYLLFNLLGLIPLTLLYLGLPEQRKNILVAGLTWIPFAPLAILHEDYWNPLRLWGLRWGVEDLLYLFNINAMGWAVTVGLTSRRFQLDLPFVINFRRLAELLSVGAVLGFLLFGSGITGMTAQIVVNTTIGFWLLYRSRSYWPITLAGLLLLPAIFLAELKLWFTIWPEFAENWNSASPWGWTIAGIPLGEFAFYLTFSIVSPASVAYCRGAVISPRQNISTLLTLDSGHEPH